MDWSKAKSILIIALLLTNCMLLSVYIFQYNRTEIVENDVKKNTVALLENKNIHVKAQDIPEENKRMPVLLVESSDTDEQMIDQALEEQTGMADREKKKGDYIVYSKKFLRQCGLYDDTVRLIEYKKTGKNKAEILYGTLYDGIAIEQSYMRCVIENGMITQFERKWYQPISFGDTTKKIMPATTALIKFMSEMEESSRKSGVSHEPVFIDKIELVYWMDDYDLEEGTSLSADTAFPTWKITYNEDKIKYILGYEQ